MEKLLKNGPVYYAIDLSDFACDISILSKFRISKTKRGSVVELISTEILGKGKMPDPEQDQIMTDLINRIKQEKWQE